MRRRLPLLLLFGLAVALALATGCETRREESWERAQAPSNGIVVDPGHAHFAVCPGEVNPTGSMMLVCLCILGLGGMLTWSWLSARRLGRQAAMEKSVDPVGPLRAGPFVLVGTVEVDDGENPVTIWIDQHGTESRNKNSWSHVWKETNRRIDVRAFVVRREDGQAIRVEPGKQVVLHDNLSRFEYGNGSTRTRIAEIKPGDRIYATGQLADIGVSGGGGVYREAPRMPRLTPARRGPMVISTEAPGGTARRLSRVQRGGAIGIGLVLAFQLLFITSRFLALHLAGATATGTIEQVRIYQTWHKPKNSSGYWTTHQEAEVSWGAGDQRAIFRIAGDLYRCALHQGCDRVVVRSAHLAGIDAAQLGSGVTLGITRGMILFIGSGIALAIWLSVLLGARPWWLRGRVVDRASGRLSRDTSSVKDAVPPAAPPKSPS